MSLTIWKFPVPAAEGEFLVQMPARARVLCVQSQVEYATVCMWAEVPPNSPKERRWFGVRATGAMLEGNEGLYVGTFQLGGFVGHLYELVKV